MELFPESYSTVDGEVIRACLPDAKADKKNVLNEMFGDWNGEKKNKFRGVMLKYKSE